MPLGTPGSTEELEEELNLRAEEEGKKDEEGKKKKQKEEEE